MRTQSGDLRPGVGQRRDLAHADPALGTDHDEDLAHAADQIAVGDQRLREIDRRERMYGIAEKLPKRAGVAQIRRVNAFGPRRRAAS